jgi:hypothetical protein
MFPLYCCSRYQALLGRLPALHVLMHHGDFDNIQSFRQPEIYFVEINDFKLQNGVIVFSCSIVLLQNDITVLFYIIILSHNDVTMLSYTILRSHNGKCKRTCIIV